MENNMVISFMTARLDHAERGKVNLFIILAVLGAFLFLADKVSDKFIVIAIIGVVVLIMVKSTQKIIFDNGKVFKVNYFGSKKTIKPKRLFVERPDNVNRFFLKYETDKLKVKKVFLNGTIEDFKHVYDCYQGSLVFSKKFKSIINA